MIAGNITPKEVYPMREYVIMTDSCCDLTDHMAKELELTVVPLTCLLYTSPSPRD